jgi:hypothetical protein
MVLLDTVPVRVRSVSACREGSNRLIRDSAMRIKSGIRSVKSSRCNQSATFVTRFSKLENDMVFRQKWGVLNRFTDIFTD